MTAPDKLSSGFIVLFGLLTARPFDRLRARTGSAMPTPPTCSRKFHGPRTSYCGKL